MRCGHPYRAVARTPGVCNGALPGTAGIPGKQTSAAGRLGAPSCMPGWERSGAACRGRSRECPGHGASGPRWLPPLLGLPAPSLPRIPAPARPALLHFPQLRPKPRPRARPKTFPTFLPSPLEKPPRCSRCPGGERGPGLRSSSRGQQRWRSAEHP